MRIFLLFRLSSLILMTMLGVLACSGDEEDDASDDSSGLAGWVETFSDGKATVSFTNAEVDQEYIIMPYHLGSIDTVQGGDTSQSEYTVTLPSSASLNEFIRDEKSSAGLFQPSTKMQMGQIYRMIMNRFNRTKSIESQDNGVWMLAKHYDELLQQNKSLNLQVAPTMTAYLKDSISSHKSIKTQKNKAKLQLTEACPTDEDEVELFVGVDTDGNQVSETDSISAVIENDDFCVILVTDELSEKLSDKTLLESTIKSILDTYKTVIYEDTFPVKNGITFKPYFIIANFEDLVDLGHSSALTSIIGAFNQDLTVSAGRPILLMTETLSGVGLGETDDNVRQYWGTLAHEVSHAISYYYKNGLDDLYIDEGAAHLAEDLFGYKGDGNYENYTSIFLQNRYSGNYPFFVSAAFTSSDSSLDSYGRAAGQTLLHYLISQKGGITYTDGALSSSAGLKFYADVIKSPDKGIKNINTIYADESLSWTEIVGNYLGALMLDGSGLDVASRYETTDVITDIKNIQGDAGKEYGFRFNGGDLETAHANISSLDGDTFEQTFYQTKPFLYKVQSVEDSIVIETLAENAGVSVVRVK